MDLTELQQGTLEAALYTYVVNNQFMYNNGNMDEETLDILNEDVTNICFKAGIRDQVQAYRDNMTELAEDIRVREAHDNYHNW